MSDKRRNPFVWLDMEMTGLEPDVCVPLQVAVVLTDDDLDEIQAVEVDIWQPESALASMEPFVRNMHTDNGLIDRVRASDKSVANAEQALMEVVADHCGYRKGILCGNSIHQDRRFLNAYFPTLAGYLHYRMVDVSSIKELVRRWYGDDFQFEKSDRANHTALADIRESIAELRHYRDAFWLPSSMS